MADNILALAERIAEKYDGKISKMLGIPSLDVDFALSDDQPNPAWQVGGSTIYLNKAWVREHMDELAGLIVHEMVNRYAGNDDDELADAVRFALTGESANWQPSESQRALAADRAALRTQAGGAPLGPEGSNEDVIAVNQQTGEAATSEGLQNSPGGGVDGEMSFEDLIQNAVNEALGTSDEDQKKAERQQERNTYNAFLNQLMGMGLAPGGNLSALAQHGASMNWDIYTFLNHVYDTPEFQDAFPGIFNENGSLKMSIDQYLSNVAQYESISAQTGVNLSDNTVAWLFENDVAPAEFATRAPAIGRLQRDPQLWRSFSAELQRNGEKVTRDGLLRFAAGLGNAAWYDLWQDAVTRNAAFDAGIEIKRAGAAGKDYTAIRQGMLERISGKDLSEDEMTAAFQEMGEHLLTTLPLSKLQGYNLSKRDIETHAFGGKHQADIRQKMKRVLEQEQRFYGPRATPALASGDQGGLVPVGRDLRAQS
jgi:hypothetical protein